VREYPKMINTAMGDRYNASLFINAQVVINITSITQANTLINFIDSAPLTWGQARVLGLSLSKFTSAILLNIIARLLALTIASIISRNFLDASICGIFSIFNIFHRPAYDALKRANGSANRE
jgi:hypothetical protein